MPAKVLMDVDEYLHKSFDGPDCEYLDGEAVERNIGELPHGTLQGRLIFLLKQMTEKLGVRVDPEIRIQINPRRFRVADVAAWRPGNIGDRIPTVPPFLVIEILSPEDRITRMQPKIQEYLSIGVEWIWLVDPDERKAICYSQGNPGGALCATPGPFRRGKVRARATQGSASPWTAKSIAQRALRRAPPLPAS